jgi:hypothetical protein
MTFARRVFTGAGIYGLIILLPLYFLEERTGIDQPPPINHPEYYYGFIGAAVAWQLVFLILGRDPVKYRPLMLPAVVEKFTYGGAVLVLLAQSRIPGPPFIGGLIDLFLGVLFIVAYAKTSAQ